jgi:hypothetical protein
LFRQTPVILFALVARILINGKQQSR